jgi:hypothetical protein
LRPSAPTAKCIWCQRFAAADLNQTPRQEVRVKAAAVVANILKREGVEFLIGYPVNPIIEAAASGHPHYHRAPGAYRPAHGRRGEPHHIGPAHGVRHAARAGAENSFGGVAQAFGDSVPIVVLPGGYPQRLSISRRTSAHSSTAASPWAEQVIRPTPYRTRCAARSRKCATAARAPCWSTTHDLLNEECRTAGPIRLHRACAAAPITRRRQVAAALAAAGAGDTPGKACLRAHGRSSKSWRSCWKRQ